MGSGNVMEKYNCDLYYRESRVAESQTKNLCVQRTPNVVWLGVRARPRAEFRDRERSVKSGAPR